MERPGRIWNQLLGAGALAVAAAIALSGCQPGTICDKGAEYDNLCGRGGAGGGGTGGGGSGGGGSGGGGSMGSDAGGMETGASIRELPVANCEMYNTVGKMDDFFKARCGSDSVCHATFVWTDMKAPDVFSRLLDKAPGYTCREGKLIDKADWQKSILHIKTTQAMPACPDGKTYDLNTIMPPPLDKQMQAMKQDPLNDAEKTCLENFIKTLAMAP